MIVNIRGTSGSGKSTLVRKILNQCTKVSNWEPDDGGWAELARLLPMNEKTGKIRGRKNPWGYLYMTAIHQSLVVIGHYESPCGGCDTISGFDLTYGLVREAHAAGHHVLFEGLIINSDVKRAVQLHEDGLPFHIVALNTSLEDCLRSVNERRQNSARAEKLREKGVELGEVNPDNTRAKYELIQKTLPRFREAGVPVEELDRHGAFYRVSQLLLGIK